MYLTRALFLVLFAACSSDPLTGTRERLVGTWQRHEAVPTFATRATFNADGSYELHLADHDQPDTTRFGLWRLTGTEDEPQLQICIDGEGFPCKTNPIWKTENLFVSGAMMSTESPDGAVKTTWDRYSEH